LLNSKLPIFLLHSSKLNPVKRTEIIPRTILEFDTYIRITNKRQLAVNAATGNPFWKDYNWTLAQSTEYKDRHDKWVDEVFKAWSTAALRTDVAKKTVPQFIRALIDYVNKHKLIDKIKTCDVVANADAGTWQFVLNRKKRSRREVGMKKTAEAMVKQMGGGRLLCKATFVGNEGRARIPREDGADCIQYAWMLMDKRDEAPANVNGTLYQKDISTKAIFYFEAGAQNSGRYLAMAFRWYNSKHKRLAGPWSEVQVHLVL
jgi:hypothetical protein